MSATCRSCGRPVYWATARVSGGRMPLDVEPDPTGLLAVYDSLDGDPTPPAEVAGLLDAGEALIGTAAGLPDDWPRWSSHFATCPQAGTWRRR